MDNATIIFGLLAAFVIWKLWSILGSNRQEGILEKDATPPHHEASSTSTSSPIQPTNSDDTSRWSPFARPDKDVANTLDYIVQRDNNFKPDAFLIGARAAYEMVITALSDHEIASIRDLLSNDVYQEFNKELQIAKDTRRFPRTIVVSLDSACIDQATCKDDQALLSISYRAKLISYVEDSKGLVTSGDKTKIFTSDDIWTFEKKVSDPNPNWILVDTRSHK